MVVVVVVVVVGVVDVIVFLLSLQFQNTEWKCNVNLEIC